MSKLNNMSKPLIWSAALLLTAIAAGCGGSNGSAGVPGAPGTNGSNGNPGSNGTPGTSAPGTNPAAVNLLSASTYALTTSSGLTTSGPTTFGGAVAMDAPTQTCTATPANATIQTGGTAVDSCGMETGTFNFTNGPITPTNAAGLAITGSTIRYAAGNNPTFNASVRAVKNDVNTAWLDAARRVGGAAIAGPGVLDGLVLLPGTYSSGSTMTLNGGQTLTLDAGAGNANAATAVWIFQVGSSLTVNSTTVAGSPTQVKLINGALAKNVFWETGSPGIAGDVTFGGAPIDAADQTVFAGTILAGRSVTFAGGTQVTGRILAGADLLGTPNGLAGAVSTTAASGVAGISVTVTLP